MNWFKENPFLTTLTAITVLGTAATTYLALDASARHAEAQSYYDTQLNNLRSLEAKKPFPNKEHAEKVAELFQTYMSEVDAYRMTLLEYEEPIEEITPQEFQDELRKSVTALQLKATENKVTIVEDFFYGFNDYQSTLPSAQDAPLLNREFIVIRKLVDSLVDLGVVSIDSLVRQPPPIQAPPPSRPGQPHAPEQPASAISFNTFALAFTASQEKFLTAFQSIPAGNRFLLIRSLLIENTNPAPPARVATTPAPSEAPVFDSATNPSPQKLEVLLGRELVKTSLTIEILDFPDLAPTPPSK